MATMTMQYFGVRNLSGMEKSGMELNSEFGSPITDFFA